MRNTLHIKRVYEPPAKSDGTRILVDRIWPRGLTKQRAAVDVWLKEIAPTKTLRSWFGHDVHRWPGFRERYFEELRGNAREVSRIVSFLSDGKVTLLFGAHDLEHSNAVALADYIRSLQSVSIYGIESSSRSSS